MAVFHFHFPPPPDDTHFEPSPVCPEHPGADALREYWPAHRDDAPAELVGATHKTLTAWWERLHLRDEALYNVPSGKLD